MNRLRAEPLSSQITENTVPLLQHEDYIRVDHIHRGTRKQSHLLPLHKLCSLCDGSSYVKHTVDYVVLEFDWILEKDWPLELLKGHQLD